MIQLNPYESFLIHRTLVDPSDSNTYYVQAVIRDADDSVIETVNLTDRGNQRFSKNWKVVADRTLNGSGRYISITTRVYTDSGYTVADTLNGQDSETYIIQRRIDGNQIFGGGGGVIDYREIGKIVAEEIKKIPKLEFPKQELPKPIDFVPITKEIIKTITDRIDKIVIPVSEKPEKVDLQPLNKSIENLSKEIRNLPRFEKTELAPLIREIQNLNSTILETHKESMKMMEENSKKNIEEIVAPILKENAKLKTILSTGLGDTSEEKQKKARELYLNKLRTQFGLK